MIRIEDATPPMIKILFHIFIDSWIAMVSLGAVASHVALPALALGYWQIVLIIIAIQALAPEFVYRLKVTDENSN